MNKLREAAQAALDALDNQFGWSPDEFPAIDALRAALAEAEQEHYCDTHCTWLDHAAGCVRAEPDLNLADPAVQKRLAAQWGYTKGEPHGEPAGRVRIDRGEVHFVPRLRDADVAGFVDGQPLYTTPPALKREPLTERARWVPVTERMPEPDAGEVLVLLTSGMCAFDEWHMHREDPTGMSTIHTIEMGLMWRDYDFEEITHWMPLPAAPEFKP